MHVDITHRCIARHKAWRISKATHIYVHFVLCVCVCLICENTCIYTQPKHVHMHVYIYTFESAFLESIGGACGPESHLKLYRSAEIAVLQY